jgi:hypothetical protein
MTESEYLIRWLIAMNRLLRRLGYFIAANMIALTTSAHATVDGLGCAIVTNTPDGFLNLRKAPTTNGAIVTKLRPGDFLYVDICQKNESFEVCGENGWAKVDGVYRLDGNNFSKQWRFHAGWTSIRFLRELKRPADMERDR